MNPKGMYRLGSYEASDGTTYWLYALHVESGVKVEAEGIGYPGDDGQRRLMLELSQAVAAIPLDSDSAGG
jgi:hypothetical protein